MKGAQLQIRVSKLEKQAIQAAAGEHSMDMSSWVLSRLFANPQKQFFEKVNLLALSPKNPGRRYALADLNDFLSSIDAAELKQAIASKWPVTLDAINSNYVCAMVELAAHKLKLAPPLWLSQIKPLDTPYFDVELPSLKAYLMRVSPIPFRSRNIFIDTSLGGRV